MTIENLRVSLVQGRDALARRRGQPALYEGLVKPLAGTTDLVLLPETFTSGFTNETLANAESMDGESLAWLKQLAATRARSSAAAS
jgi:predicted amidohydrolase